MKVKEMIYGDRKPKEILAEGSREAYTYKVISLGSHPCGYVSIPEYHPLYEKLDILESMIDCHGGITFDGRMKDFGTEYFIGWDYAHAGDFMGGLGENEMEEWKKYTTEEIINECHYVIGQLQMYDCFDKVFDFKENQELVKKIFGD